MSDFPAAQATYSELNVGQTKYEIKHWTFLLIVTVKNQVIGILARLKDKNIKRVLANQMRTKQLNRRNYT